VETDAFSLKNVSGILEFEFHDTEMNIFNIDDISRLFLNILKSYADPYEAISFEMRNVRIVDSSAVAFLVKALLVARKNKKDFFIKNLSEGIRKTLECANLIKDLSIK